MAIGNFLASLGGMFSGRPQVQQTPGFVGTHQGTDWAGNQVPGMGGGNPMVADVVRQVQAMPQAQARSQAQAQPRQRRSAAQWIGEIGDAIAVAGQGQPIYRMEQERLQQQQLGQQKLEQERVNAAMKGYEAIMASGATPEQAMAQLPALLQSANASPETVARITELAQTNPQALAGLSGMAGAAREPVTYTGNPLIFRNTQDGSIRIGFRGSDGNVKYIEPPEGYEATEPLQFLNAGGQFQGVGRNSGDPRGAPVQITQSADNAANNATSAARIDAMRSIARGNNETTLEAARIRAENSGRSRDKKGGNPAEIAATAAPLLSDLRSAVDTLNARGGMSNTGRSPMGSIGALIREEVPFVERITDPEAFSARQTIQNIATVGIPTLLPLLTGVTIGGKNFDAAKELDVWRNAIVSAKDYNEAIRAIDFMESRVLEILQSSDQYGGSRTSGNAGGNRGTTGQSRSRSDLRSPSRPQTINPNRGSW